jgi:ribosomal protein S18 acetylase RimI-like enzyme
MKLEIREYKSSDEPRLIELMEDFQDYLVDIDYMKRTRRTPAYGVSYVGRLLRKINNNDGVIYLAEHEGQVIGLVAALIETQSEDDLLECIPSKGGRILELYVEPSYRKQGIGELLMAKAEEYIRRKQCDVLRIEVFEPNTNAHRLYDKLGYQDRIIDMIKKIRD